MSSSLEQKTDALSEWIKTQEQLPQKINRNLLKRFVFSSREDLDRAKALVLHNLQLRDKAKHLFFERDPLSPGAQMAFEATNMMVLPKLTDKNYKIILFSLADNDPDKYNFTDIVRQFFMMCDVSLITPEPTTEHQIPEGDIPIYDMGGVKFKHVTKTVFSVLQVFMKYTQEAHPIRLKHIHLINVPSFIDRIMSILRPFMKKEVARLMHVHKTGSETLFEHVPRELLPNEYGGTCGTVADLKAVMKKRIESHRDYLMDASNWALKDINDNTKSDAYISNGTKLESRMEKMSFD